MFDPRRVREDDRDQVEADRLDIDARATRPGPRRPALRDLFDRVHRAFGRSMLLALARFDLDEHRALAVRGHYVDLGQPRAGPVACEHAVTLFLQITLSQVLGAAPERALRREASAGGARAQRIDPPQQPDESPRRKPRMQARAAG